MLRSACSASTGRTWIEGEDAKQRLHRNGHVGSRASRPSTTVRRKQPTHIAASSGRLAVTTRTAAACWQSPHGTPYASIERGLPTRRHRAPRGARVASRTSHTIKRTASWSTISRPSSLLPRRTARSLLRHAAEQYARGRLPCGRAAPHSMHTPADRSACPPLSTVKELARVR